MDRRILVLVLLLAVVGVAFAGRGLTGHVTSQTCCTDSLCPAQYRCSLLYPDEQVPSAGESELFYAVGLLFLIGAAGAFYANRRLH